MCLIMPYGAPAAHRVKLTKGIWRPPRSAHSLSSKRLQRRNWGTAGSRLRRASPDRFSSQRLNASAGLSYRTGSLSVH